MSGCSYSSSSSSSSNMERRNVQSIRLMMIENGERSRQHVRGNKHDDTWYEVDARKSTREAAPELSSRGNSVD